MSLDDQKALALAVAVANLSITEKIEAFMAGIRATDPTVSIRINFTYPRPTRPKPKRTKRSRE